MEVVTELIRGQHPHLKGLYSEALSLSLSHTHNEKKKKKETKERKAQTWATTLGTHSRVHQRALNDLTRVFFF